MEKRKVTTLGKYSYIITLPKDWVKLHKLNSGDSVFVQVDGDGSLVINPSIDLHEESTETSIFIKKEEHSNSIIRKVIGCYLNGFNLVHLKSADSFTSEQQNAVRNVVKSLYMRILESTSRSITLQTLMDESMASVVSGIERMHIITSSMSKDVLHAMSEWDEDLARSVVTLEDDVDQFMFYLLRLLRSSVENPSLASKLGLSMSDCFDYHLIVNRIEYVADHLTDIAITITKLTESRNIIPDRVMTSLLESARTSFHYYDLAVDAFFSGKLEDANEIIDNRDLLGSIIDVTESIPIEKEKETIIQLCRIRDNIIRISSFAADIAELTIDRSFRI